MWANSVWGLFGLAASCVLTMLGLSPVSPWRPFLLAGAVMFVIGSIGVLSWPLRKADNRAKVATMIIHPTRALRLIEPSHVVILGLAIAVAGVIWQWRRTPPPDSQINELRSQIEELTKRLAAASTSAQPSVTPAKQAETSKPLSPRDVQRILEALDEISRYGEATIWPTINAINSWAVNWRGVIRNRNGEQLYTKYRDDLKTEVWDRIDSILAKYSKYDIILQDALALNDPTAKNELAKSLQEAIEALGKLPKNSPLEMDDLVAPQFKELIRQSGFAYQWEVEARRRITEMQDNLKKDGVAAYAKRPN